MAKDTPSAERPLDGIAVLVVEDELLIGLDTQETLIAFGGDPVVLVNTLDEALTVLASQTFQLALLDLNLGDDQTSVPIAEALGAVPMVFTTGYEPDAELLARFKAVHVQKPYSRPQLQGAIARILARPPGA